MFTALLGVALAAGVVPAAAPAQDFAVAGVALTVRPPDGYCAPAAGKAAAVMQAASAMDTVNVTHVALVECADTDASRPDYYLIKTPTDALAVTIARPELLAEMKKTFALPAFNVPEGVVDNGKVAKDVTRVTGEDAEIKGAIKPLGVDDTCAYMGGVLSFAGSGVAYSRAVSMCMTSVAGKIVAVTRYSDGTPGNVRRHLASARALALAISAK